LETDDIGLREQLLKVRTLCALVESRVVCCYS
jgi:hypothetical protein